MIYEIISMIGLGLCALMGIGALVSPAWAAGVVRLQADPEKPGGYAEFRATYGGLLLMVHMMALVMVYKLGPTFSALLVVPIAMGWYGAAIGRLISLALDRSKLGGTGMNHVWVLTEILLGTMIGLPILSLLV